MIWHRLGKGTELLLALSQRSLGLMLGRTVPEHLQETAAFQGHHQPRAPKTRTVFPLVPTLIDVAAIRSCTVHFVIWHPRCLILLREQDRRGAADSFLFGEAGQVLSTAV